MITPKDVYLKIERALAQFFFNVFFRKQTTVNFRHRHKSLKVEIRMLGWNVGEYEIK